MLGIIILDEYERLFKLQKRVCKICNLEETSKHINGKPKSLAVDRTLVIED